MGLQNNAICVVGTGRRDFVEDALLMIISVSLFGLSHAPSSEQRMLFTYANKKLMTDC